MVVHFLIIILNSALHLLFIIYDKFVFRNKIKLRNTKEKEILMQQKQKETVEYNEKNTWNIMKVKY